jgi:hypothetical protein
MSLLEERLTRQKVRGKNVTHYSWHATSSLFLLQAPPLRDRLLGALPALTGTDEFSLSATGVLVVFTVSLLCIALKLGIVRALKGTVLGRRVAFVLDVAQGATGVVVLEGFVE